MRNRTSVFVVAVGLAAGCGSPVDGNGGGGGIASGGGGGNGEGSGSAVGDLAFAIVGDTRPPTQDDTNEYPTAIVTKIFQDIEAESPRPSFVVGTGDYQYADPTGDTQGAQLGLYMSARGEFSGAFYPAMGNHECTGYTDSNCGAGNPDGVTANMTAFAAMMLGPIGETQPYYVERMRAADASWTAKLVVIACNAWTPAQSAWLTAQLAVPTTYTFVVRHESVADMAEAECSESQTLVEAAPLTLLIAGHTHEYSHEPADKEIINGIGGAPLTSGTDYGYSIVVRGADGSLTVTTKDYADGSQIDSFAIKPDGTPD
jgi:hypothetical protein